MKAWNKAREKSGIYLKPKDLRDFFTQEMGRALIPDRYIDIFQGRAPRNILAKHYSLREKDYSDRSMTKLTLPSTLN